MKIISWNVAGFRAVLKKGFDDFFREIDADIFCIQESKVLEEQFDYRPEGYKMYLNPAEKKCLMSYENHSTHVKMKDTHEYIPLNFQNDFKGYT